MDVLVKARVGNPGRTSKIRLYLGQMQLIHTPPLPLPSAPSSKLHPQNTWTSTDTYQTSILLAIVSASAVSMSPAGDSCAVRAQAGCVQPEPDWLMTDRYASQSFNLDWIKWLVMLITILWGPQMLDCSGFFPDNLIYWGMRSLPRVVFFTHAPSLEKKVDDYHETGWKDALCVREENIIF